jgi:hypothetical protein
VTRAITVYVVTRAGFYVSDAGDSFPLLSSEVVEQWRSEADRGQRRVPEAAFENRAEAVQEAQRRERAARALLNPFCLEGAYLRSVTSLPAYTLRELFAMYDLNPPAAGADEYEDGRNLARWWDAESANWTAELRAELWDLFDKVKLYDVQEVPFE